MKKFLTILVVIIILGGFAYYWFFVRAKNTPAVPGQPTTQGNIFNPFRRGTVTPAPAGGVASSTDQGITQAPLVTTNEALPKLRQLSTTPVGGFMASSTASTSLVRYVDRGVGHVEEVHADSPSTIEITNTTIPKVSLSYWNKNLTAAVFRYIKDDGDAITNFYAEVRTKPFNASSTDPIPAEIKGKFISSAIKEIAVSPKRDKIFTWNIENGIGVGYISGFDESKKTKVIEAPLTQVTIDWPEENTIALSTKATATLPGYLYLINLKKPVLNLAIGKVTGLTARVSSDAKAIIYSSASTNGYQTSLYSVKDGTTQELVFNTPAEKCVWSKIHPTDAYCAVPLEIPAGTYPDDWYRGTVAFADQIWHLDSTTGDVNVVANPLSLANVLIDATNLTLDPKENFLYFVNKRDLTLWSLDLNQ